MLNEIMSAIRNKIQTKPTKNHTLINTKEMKKATAKKVMSEAKGKTMTKGKKMMDKKPMSKKSMPMKGMKKGY
jgi:hypothetical protein